MVDVTRDSNDTGGDEGGRSANGRHRSMAAPECGSGLELGQRYAVEWHEWESADDAELWDGAVGDGIEMGDNRK
ncbi:hypothetical protein [Dermacoccus nishinomiyaensis]|uniref:hypothetical protein n=1 Tax=Dermacoccus nishinomiyaensis TaxID=1274 RepID=UPI0021A95761|nr:hypothetical protein [Dermacoccus nishinomiyaensis]MCT1604393.1 hypothetical protein [Dermacoccus nishinomiyaensis]